MKRNDQLDAGRRKFLTQTLPVAGITTVAAGFGGTFWYAISELFKEQTIEKQRSMPVAYQETPIFPVPASPEQILPVHRKAWHNMVRIIDCNGAAQGSGIFINPYQILTAEHVVNAEINPEWDYLVLHGNNEIEVKNTDVDSDSLRADIAILNLREPVNDVYSLQFSDREPAIGLEVAVLAYDGNDAFKRRRYMPAKVTRGEQTLGYNPEDAKKFSIDRLCVPGNSGGAIIDMEGRILGVTHAQNTTTTIIVRSTNLTIIDRCRGDTQSVPSDIVHPLGKERFEGEYGKIIDRRGREWRYRELQAADGSTCTHILPKLKTETPDLKSEDNE